MLQYVTPSSAIQPAQITLSILFYPHNYTSLLEYHQELLRNTRSYVVYQNVVPSPRDPGIHGIWMGGGDAVN